MTQLQPPPPVRIPSPAPSDDADVEHDDDDKLSITSSDLEASWLDVNVPPRLPSQGSSTASALGSSTISELPVSDRDETDLDDAWILSSDAGSEAHTDTEADEADDHLDDTPAVTDSFQRSFIFPDPNSASASFVGSSATASTVVDDTPLQSYANVRLREVREEDKKEDVTAPKPQETTTSTSFRAQAPRPGRKSWSMMAFILAVTVVVLKFSAKSPELALESTKVVQNATPEQSGTRWGLGVADLQIVRDTLSSINKEEAPAPPEEEPSSEYHYAWSRVIPKRTPPKITTDLAIVPQALAPSIFRYRCNCPILYCSCPRSERERRRGPLMLLEDFVRWTMEALQTLSFHAAIIGGHARRYLDDFAEEQAAFMSNIVNDFIHSKHLQRLFKTAARTPSAATAMQDAIVRASRHVCADGRCDIHAHGRKARKALRHSQQQAQRVAAQLGAESRRAADRATENAIFIASVAHQRGHETLHRARRGLDNLVRRVAASCSEGSEAGQRKSAPQPQHAQSRCGRRCRQSKAKGQNGVRNHDRARLKCGFRGYTRGRGAHA